MSVQILLLNLQQQLLGVVAAWQIHLAWIRFLASIKVRNSFLFFEGGDTTILQVSCPETANTLDLENIPLTSCSSPSITKERLLSSRKLLE